MYGNALSYFGCRVINVKSARTSLSFDPCSVNGNNCSVDQSVSWERCVDDERGLSGRGMSGRNHTAVVRR